VNSCSKPCICADYKNNRQSTATGGQFSAKESKLLDESYLSSYSQPMGKAMPGVRSMLKADSFDAAWDQHQAPRRQLTKDWLNAVAEGRWNDPVGTEGISPAARLG
jgi:hypothetical protein